MPVFYSFTFTLISPVNSMLLIYVRIAAGFLPLSTNPTHIFISIRNQKKIQPLNNIGVYLSNLRFLKPQNKKIPNGFNENPWESRVYMAVMESFHSREIENEDKYWVLNVMLTSGFFP